MAFELKRVLASPRVRKAFLLLALLSVLFFVCNDVLLPWYVNQGGIIEVPSVVGRSFDDAKQYLDSVGLEARVGEIRTDRTHREGIVVAQNPIAGHQVKRDRRIYLSVSGGEQMVVVPGIRGRSLRDARFALEREGLQIGAIDYKPSEEYPANTIMEQAISPGSKVKRDSYISIVVSQGSVSQEVIVPDVSGKTLSEAEGLLSNSNLKVGNITYLPSSELLPNTIIEQFPRKGETVAKGQAIDLFVVQGGELKKDVFEY